MAMQTGERALCAEWRYEAKDLHALRAVRGSALELLRREGEPGSDFEACAIIMSELMSNATLHGPGGSIRVSLEWSEKCPTIAVTDPGTGFKPVIALPPAERESGRGLYLVTHLGTAPRVSIDAAGCTVSVRLPVERS